MWKKSSFPRIQNKYFVEYSKILPPHEKIPFLSDRYFWKTCGYVPEPPISFPAHGRFSSRIHRSLWIISPTFSTKKYPFSFHNDSLHGPKSSPDRKSLTFWEQNWIFPQSFHRKPLPIPQTKQTRETKNILSYIDFSLIHSFHPPYGYYFWYSLVQLCNVSCCQARARARGQTHVPPRARIQ